MVKIRTQYKKDKGEKKRREKEDTKYKADWYRAEEKKIPSYSSAAQIKKFWEVHQPISSEADWEGDSSVEVEESKSREVKNVISYNLILHHLYFLFVLLDHTTELQDQGRTISGPKVSKDRPFEPHIMLYNICLSVSGQEDQKR